jgi:hypothetical protein
VREVVAQVVAVGEVGVYVDAVTFWHGLSIAHIY